MSQLRLMYVYFDKNFDIRCISPAEDISLKNDCRYTLLPLKDVEDFMVGKKNTFDYQIKEIKKFSGSSFILSKKASNVILARSLDFYLKEIPNDVVDPTIRIITNVNTKRIAIILNEGFDEIYKYGSIEEQEKIEEFISMGTSSVHITKKGNPYHLLFTISFDSKKLFDEKRIDFDYPETLDLRNSSAYTKKIIDGYCYTIRDFRNAT